MTLPVFDPQFSAYIWAVYALGAAALGLMVLFALMRAARAKKALDEVEALNRSEPDA